MINNTCQNGHAQAKATSDTLKIISREVMRVDESDNESMDDSSGIKLADNETMKTFKKSFQNLVGKKTFKSADTFEDKILILKKLVLKKKKEEISQQEMVIHADELFSGSGVEKDVESAMDIYRKMSENNNARAKFKLAEI